MSQQLAVWQHPLVLAGGTPLGLSNEQLQLICERIAPNCSPAEVGVFLYQAKRTGLDPFSRQIYCVKYSGKEKPASIVTSIDGFRVIAERSGKYQGQTETQWCGIDGVWKDVWLQNANPAAARIGVYRSDFREPIFAVATYTSYCSRNYEGKPTSIWSKMPELMLSKCAEALALRKAFPNDMSGLYTEDEMEQARIVPKSESFKPDAIVTAEFVEEPEQPQPKQTTPPPTPTPTPPTHQGGREPRQMEAPERESIKNRLKALMIEVEGQTLTDPKTGEVKPDMVANVRSAETRLAGLLDLHPGLCPLRTNGTPSLGAADTGQLFRIIRIYEELKASAAVDFGGAAMATARSAGV